MASTWMTPFKKQCFVVVGASINMAQIGMVMGFSSSLLPQLRDDVSTIPIDGSYGSWLAAVPGIALLAGNLIVPKLMANLGRKKASLISIIIVTTGWAFIAATRSIHLLMLGRILQGISCGMSSCITPVMIGEYTSPINRGAFSILMSVIMATGTLTVHTLGSYLPWRITALVIIVIGIVDLFMVILSPESPSWLAGQGKYEECKKVFTWLRGTNVDELNKLIQSNMVAVKPQDDKYSASSKFKSWLTTAKMKEFYVPIVIMVHLYVMGQLGGINLLAPYVVDIANGTIGTDSDMNIAVFVLSLDLQRVLSSILAVFLIRRFNRRSMLFATCGLNALVFLVTALYIYAKSIGLITFDHCVIGGILIHLLMLTIAIGSLPLPFTIAGEIFALKYRSVSSGISAIVYSLCIFIVIKTFPYLLSEMGLIGAYCLYAAIMIYCLFIVWFLLPETKDKTLEDIEDAWKVPKNVKDDKFDETDDPASLQMITK